MNIKTPNPQKEYLIRKLTGLLHRLENTGRGNFVINGEADFVNNIGKLYAKKSLVVFDIGANRGEYTDMIIAATKDSLRSLHLFEPQGTCLKLLSEKFGNGQVARLNNFGLSDKETSATLYKDVDASGLASVHKRNIDHFNIHMDMTEQISLRKASDYIKEQNVQHINLIKIDVEGHEIQALSGFGGFLNSENVDFVQFEYGGANLDSHTSLMDLFNFFESRGFKVCKMMPKCLEIRSYDPRLENFFYQNYVAVSPRML
ncbi:MAG: FkbM family methyltransferase [bacterium]|nr:FkbM family methyltransferase [bacterium]